ncbi:MAG: hypothetical protein GY755_04560, partial [Chloroflexi bacterium]|nr:hypothetical protein [Chloroflexota bacterium]
KTIEHINNLKRLLYLPAEDQEGKPLQVCYPQLEKTDGPDGYKELKNELVWNDSPEKEKLDRLLTDRTEAWHNKG